MKLLKILMFALALLACAPAMARTPVPVVDFPDQPVSTASGKALAADQVVQAVRSAAVARKWVVTAAADGKLTASLSWNGNKHSISVLIACTADRYSIAYKDSDNMKYSPGDGQPLIHPYYNRFVGELNEAIRAELASL